MENKINTKLEKHQVLFKTAIKNWLDENNATIIRSDKDITSEFMQFMYGFDKLSISKEDLQKRTRVKNAVPKYDLCIAKIANETQCTRRKQGDDSTFCGTHIKGQPYGIVANNNDTDIKQKTKKVEVWVQEIKGISYYIDSENNVYKTEDILSNKTNPQVVAKWGLSEDNTYTIPAFNI